MNLIQPVASSVPWMVGIGNHGEAQARLPPVCLSPPRAHPNRVHPQPHAQSTTTLGNPSTHLGQTMATTVRQSSVGSHLKAFPMH